MSTWVYVYPAVGTPNHPKNVVDAALAHLPVNGFPVHTQYHDWPNKALLFPFWETDEACRALVRDLLQQDCEFRMVCHLHEGDKVLGFQLPHAIPASLHQFVQEPA